MNNPTYLESKSSLDWKKLAELPHFALIIQEFRGLFELNLERKYLYCSKVL
jgi:hypothetical protein